MRKNCLRYDHHTDDIDIEETANIVQSRFLQRSAVSETGIVDQHIDTLEMRHRHLNGATDGSRVGDIHRQTQQARRIVSVQMRQRVNSAVGGDDALPAVDQLLCQAGAKAGRATGDEPGALRMGRSIHGHPLRFQLNRSDIFSTDC
jgi:hypothetical protein